MKKLLTILLAIILVFSLSACSEELTGNENGELSDKEENESSKLTTNILSHIDDWEYVCDDFTKNYTYDDIEVTGISLYLADTQGEYYFAAIYTVPNQRVVITYHQVFYVTESAFDYVYGSEYSAQDITVKNCKLLSMQILSNNSNKEELVQKLVEEGLETERKYFEEINLNDSNIINLTDDEVKLFNNMCSAITMLEYYETSDGNQIPLSQIEYYVLENGACEVLMKYEAAPIYSVKGYFIDENGYEELLDLEISRLENTSNKIWLDWNIEWTTEKKEFVLKKAISEK